MQKNLNAIAELPFKGTIKITGINFDEYHIEPSYVYELESVINFLNSCEYPCEFLEGDTNDIENLVNTFLNTKRISEAGFFYTKDETYIKVYGYHYINHSERRVGIKAYFRIK